MSATDLVTQLATLGPGKPLLDDERNVVVLGPEKSGLPVDDGTVDAAGHDIDGVHLLLGRGTTPAGVARVFLTLIAKAPAGPVPATTGVAPLESLGEELVRWASVKVFGGQPVDPLPDAMAPFWASGTLLPIPLRCEQTGADQRLVADLAWVRSMLDRSYVVGAGARMMVGSLLSFDPFRRPLPFEKFSIDEQGKGKRKATPTPGFDEVSAARDRVLTEYQADPAAQAQLWRKRWSWNPYAAVFPLLHLLATLPAAQRRGLIAALFGVTQGVDALLFQRLTGTSAGAALARAVIYQGDSDADTDQARARALARFGDEAAELRDRAVVFPGVEPPAPVGANLAARRAVKLVVAPSFLGREVKLTWSSYKQDSGETWTGPLDAGSVTPGALGHLNPTSTAQLAGVGDAAGDPLQDAALTDRLLVIRAICEIEGYADAVRATDRALVSIGLQQFSFHVAEEATALLRRVRGISDFWFDVFFRSLGLEVGRAPHDASYLKPYEKGKPDQYVPRQGEIPYEALQKASVARTAVPLLPRPTLEPVTQAQTPAQTQAQLSEPAWLIKLGTTAGSNQWCVPGRVGAPAKISGVPTSPTALPPVSDEAGQYHTDCHAVFGFTGTTATPDTEAVLVRWAVAARLVPEVMRAQMEAALHRFNRLERHAAQEVKLQIKHPKNGPDVDVSHTRWEWLSADTEVPVSFRDLVSCQAHAAAVVDCYINTPNSALGAVRRAHERAAREWQALPGNAQLDLADDQFRLLFFMAYLSERWYFTAAEPARWMTKYGERTVGWQQFCGRGGTNNVAADRIARLLSRVAEAEPPPPGPADLMPRKLSWCTPFHWT